MTGEKTGRANLQGKTSGYRCVRGGRPRRLGPSRLLHTVPSTRCIQGHICMQESRASGPNYWRQSLVRILWYPTHINSRMQ